MEGWGANLLFDFYFFIRDVAGTGFAISPKWDTKKPFCLLFSLFLCWHFILVEHNMF